MILRLYSSMSSSNWVYTAFSSDSILPFYINRMVHRTWPDSVILPFAHCGRGSSFWLYLYIASEGFSQFLHLGYCFEPFQISFLVFHVRGSRRWWKLSWVSPLCCCWSSSWCFRGADLELQLKGCRFPHPWGFRSSSPWFWPLFALWYW